MGINKNAKDILTQYIEVTIIGNKKTKNRI